MNTSKWKTEMINSNLHTEPKVSNPELDIRRRVLHATTPLAIRETVFSLPVSVGHVHFTPIPSGTVSYHQPLVTSVNQGHTAQWPKDIHHIDGTSRSTRMLNSVIC